ncbi:ABC transporter permease [Enterococcus faecium]|uniref:ABC transporter permease n=1 Tax=Enterococcus faecium TaxID=1352 RepID=UPI001883A282|nr:ABC transporter permease [Enterococcus faecium]MBE9859978.1 ABC transporter permease [Enterococcus faecium]
MKRFKKISEVMLASPIYTFSVVFLTLLIVLSLVAPLIPIDPNATDVSNMSQPPSWSHLFGTDEVGRDYFIRVVYGGRVSLFVGVLAMITATFIGTLVGLVSGYFGGWIDNLLMRLVDVLSSIPWLVLVIVLSVFLRPGLTTIIIVIGGFSWMNIARLIRGETLAVKEREYVAYGKFIGRSSFSIIVKHVFPAVLPTLIVAASASISGAIMTESALSFLGLGIQQPMASWGSLLQNAQNSLQRAPYMAILPGFFVIFTIYSFNNIGDMIKHVLQREV